MAEIDLDPLINKVIQDSGIEACLQVDTDTYSFSPEIGIGGFKPIIKALIASILGPSFKIIDILNLMVKKPPKFLIKLKDLKIPNIIIEPFNANLSGIPSIPIPSLKIKVGDPNISLPFPNVNIKILTGLSDFIGKLILVPIKIFEGIFDKLLSLSLDFNLKDLISVALKGIPLNLDPSLNLVNTFSNCITKVITKSFEITGLVSAANETEASRDKEITEQSKLALKEHKKGNDKEALSIIEENYIEPDVYQKKTDVEAFFTVIKENNKFKARLIKSQ